MDEDTIEIKGLDKLIKILKQKPTMIQIGVLGNSGRTPKKGQKNVDNATIAAVHEFGAPARGIPQRSFLRVPLIEHLGAELDKAGLTSDKAIREVIDSGTMLPWIKKISVLALSVIDDAFETSGFGAWPKWKDPNYHNEGGMLLVDTGQLRQSITSEVKEQ